MTTASPFLVKLIRSDGDSLSFSSKLKLLLRFFVPVDLDEFKRIEQQVQSGEYQVKVTEAEL